MFRKNKIEKEYIRRAENLQIPKINGEQFIKINSTENKNIFKFPKYMVRVACICTIIIFSTVGINYFNYGKTVENGNNEGSNVISTAFGIKAYAATTDGKDSVDLIENQVIEVPSGNIENGEINIKGIEVRGEKIKNIKVSCINGSFGFKSTSGSLDSVGGYSESTVRDVEFKDPIVASFADKYGCSYACSQEEFEETVRRIESGEIKLKDVHNILITDKETGELLGGECKDFVMGNSQDDEIGEAEIAKMVQNGEDSSVVMNSSNKNELDIDFTGREDKYFILWSPIAKVIEQLSQGDINDYSKLEGDSIKIQVTFEDGTVKENTLNLSFSKEGNILFELK